MEEAGKKSGGAPPAKVLRMHDLIGYQEGAIVSRTLVNRPAGTVTMFAFDAGEELSEHTAPYDALVEVIDGEVRLTLSGNDMTLRAGEMVLMPAHQPHALKAVTRFKMVITMIRS